MKHGVYLCLLLSVVVSSMVMVGCGSDDVIAAVVPAPGAFNLLSPVDGAENLSINPTLEWTESENATLYGLEVHTSQDFEGEPAYVFAVQAPDTSHQITAVGGAEPLESDETYYWRVTASNLPNEELVVSEVWSFMTED